MAMSMRKKAAGIVLVGASTLALVGAGVGAVVTETVTGTFNVQTRVMDLRIVGWDNTPHAAAPAGTISADENSITFAPAVLSVNAEKDVPIGIFRLHNSGNQNMMVSATATDALDNQLPDGVKVSFKDHDGGPGVTGGDIYLTPGSTRRVQVYVSHDDLTSAQQGQSGSLKITVTGTAVEKAPWE